jgi:acyl-CoA thioester hydrolase
MAQFQSELECVQQLPVHHRITIPEKYIDQYGHVNVMWYGEMRREGARAMMGEIGFDDAYREERRMGHWALRQVLDFLAEVHVGDDVTIHGRIIGRSAIRLHNKYWMVNETKGKIAATSEALMANADLDARRMTPYPEDVAEKLDAAIDRFEMMGWDPRISGAIRP